MCQCDSIAGSTTFVHSYFAFTQLFCLYIAILPLHSYFAFTQLFCLYTAILPLHSYFTFTQLFCLYTAILPLHSYFCLYGSPTKTLFAPLLPSPPPSPIFPSSLSPPSLPHSPASLISALFSTPSSPTLPLTFKNGRRHEGEGLVQP